MSIAKTIEIVSASNAGVEDAVRKGVSKASETVKGIEGAWVKDVKVIVKGKEVTEWRVTLAVTFIVE
jgi:flavin-binding protein dodecin